MKSKILYGVLALAPTLAPHAPADALRDPTRPPVVAASHESGIREPAPVLSAIMRRSGKRIAIFNGQLVHDGDSVGAYTIDAILEDRVNYRHGGLTQEVYLPLAASFKTPSTSPARPPARAP
jgi:hypothetical protein